jgi:7,8-dihydropterin-6-yl-methyl-4-(beta-D-ribofuranosyl)aminobenzene 5'-phosphate synthase
MHKTLRITLTAIAALAVLGGGLMGYRAIARAQMRIQIEREQRAAVQPLADVGSTRTLEILPLAENETALPGLQIDRGVSYLIKTDHANILLDVGFNPNALSPSPLEANMQQLGVSPADFDTLVISHWHPDHTGGQNWWIRKTFSPGNQQIDLSGKQVFAPTVLTYPGLTPIVHNEPSKLADGVALIGTVPFLEVINLPGIPLRNTEQALAVNVEGRGIVLITGCGHPTLPVLVARTQAAFSQPVVGVVGGLHLAGAPAATIQANIDLLRNLNAQIVSLSPHDSTPDIVDTFRQAFPGVYQDVKVGQIIHLESD